MEVINLRNSLNQKGYIHVKNIIEPQLCSFLQYSSLFIYHYSILENNDLESIVSKKNENSSIAYSPVIGETLLEVLTPIYSQIVGKKLIPSYSLYRLYKKGNELLPHKDRPSCQYSATIQIDSEKDKIWKFGIKDKEGNEISIGANLGDVIFYKGQEVRHWRKPLKYEFSAHLFLHWVNGEDPNYKDYWYDGREYLGYPQLKN